MPVNLEELTQLQQRIEGMERTRNEREEAGWRAGIGLTIGLWRGPDRWRTAPAGIARSGAIMAEMFVDEDGNGLRGADEASVEGGRFIVGAALRREETGADGTVLIGGIAPGPDVDIETQMSSLTDFTLRPAHAGDRLALRPGEIRHVPVALRPTGSIEVQVLLVAGDQRTPRSGVTVVLRDTDGREAAPVFGWDMADLLSVSPPVSDAEAGLFEFDGVPVKALTLDSMRTNPNIGHFTAERSLGKLGGLIRTMPWVGWLTLLGVLASAGLPPLGGFVSEWLLLQSFLFTPGLPVPLSTPNSSDERNWSTRGRAT